MAKADQKQTKTDTQPIKKVRAPKGTSTTSLRDPTSFQHDYDLPPCEVSTTTEGDSLALERNALPQSPPPPNPAVIEPTDKDAKDTTIKMPVDLKTELDALKVDDKEPYAGVIRRLVDGKPPAESTDETVQISLPRKVYQMILMILPNNMGDQVRKGVR